MSLNLSPFDVAEGLIDVATDIVFHGIVTATAVAGGAAIGVSSFALGVGLGSVGLLGVATGSIFDSQTVSDVSNWMVMTAMDDVMIKGLDVGADFAHYGLIGQY